MTKGNWTSGVTSTEIVSANEYRGKLTIQLHIRGDSSDTHCINVTNVSQITVKAKLISMDNKGFTLEFDLCNELFTIRWGAVG